MDLKLDAGGALPTLSPGLVAVTGDEGRGKTHLLRRLGAELPDALWLDLAWPQHAQHTPREAWDSLRGRCPHWNEELLRELAEALGLAEHLGKKLFMLSTGSRRKVALAALLASGATVTCLDQPYAALDSGSVQVLREFLTDMAGDTRRSWVVADYEADPQLPWRQRLSLD
jgi:ABC-type transport system involved in cytochrome c biogenesis ATPase subunit